MPPSAQLITTALVPPAMPTDKNGFRTMTWNTQRLVFPQASVAVATTVLVVSRLKTVPDGGEEVTVTELHESVADRDQVTARLVLHVSTTIFEGQRIVGLFVSIRVTV